MNPPIFYAPPTSIDGNIIKLPKTEAHHALSVLRLREDSLVTVIDGLGMAYHGQLKHRPRNSAEVHFHQEHRNFGEPTVFLTLAAGMSTADKFDSIVQKGTELGVSRFVPVLSVRSKVKFTENARTRTRIERLEKVALAAVKQCRRSYRPEIAYPTSLSEFLRTGEPEDLKVVFNPPGQSVRSLYDLRIEQMPRRANLLIGPESGFSDDEIDLARHSGYTVISLGERILRTETVGPTAVALIMYLLGELR